MNTQTVHTDLIVLNRLRYGETSLIVRAFTRELGLQSYLVKGVLGAKKKGLRASYFQSLTLLNAVVTTANTSRLFTIKEAKPLLIGQGYLSDVVKSNVALFMAEVIASVLSEGHPEQELFDFVSEQANRLEKEKPAPDSLIKFLLGITRHLGSYPDQVYKPGQVFDLNEGIFTDQFTATQALSVPTSARLASYLGIDFDKVTLHNDDKTTRKELLEGLLDYLSAQIAGFKHPKSLEIIQSIF